MAASCPTVKATVWPVSAENFAAITFAAAEGAPVLKTRSSAASVARGAITVISINAALAALCQRRKCAAARHSRMLIGMVLPTTKARFEPFGRARTRRNNMAYK